MSKHYKCHPDINVLVLIRRNEQYIFKYTDENRAKCLKTLGRYANNPNLSFTWYDAAVLSQKIRQEYEAEIKKIIEARNRQQTKTD